MTDIQNILNAITEANNAELTNITNNIKTILPTLSKNDIERIENHVYRVLLDTLNNLKTSEDDIKYHILVNWAYENFGIFPKDIEKFIISHAKAENYRIFREYVKILISQHTDNPKFTVYIMKILRFIENKNSSMGWYIKFIATLRTRPEIVQFILKNKNSNIEKTLNIEKYNTSLIFENDVKFLGIDMSDTEKIKYIQKNYYIEFILYITSYEFINYTAENINKYTNMVFELKVPNKLEFLKIIGTNMKLIASLKNSEYFEEILSLLNIDERDIDVLNVVKDIYMYKNLRKLNSCNLQRKIAKSDINYENINKLLSNCDNSYSELQAISCLFREYLNINFSTEKSLFPLLPDINETMVSIKKLDVNSAQGVIQFMRFLDNNSAEIVMKQMIDKAEYSELIREYYIGMHLNSLREITPCFMYTYFAIINNDVINVAYQKIDGESLFTFLQNPDLTFDTFFSIYGQILLALEVAQRKYKYAHYDLHGSNIIVKKCPIKYSIYLDDKEYQVDSEYIPVMIDYGFSTLTENEGHTYGIKDYENLGIFNFLIAGRDVYQLLVLSLYYIQNIELKLQILQFFYYTSDPYNLKKVLSRKKGETDKEIFNRIQNVLKKVSSEYFVKLRPYIHEVSNLYKYNDVILSTPLSMFQDMIKSNQKIFNVVTRKSLVPHTTTECFLSIINSLLINPVFSEKEIITCLIEKISTKIPNKDSYLGYMYIESQLRKMVNISENISNSLIDKAKTYIANDIKVLFLFEEFSLSELNRMNNLDNINSYNDVKFLQKYIKAMDTILMYSLMSNDIDSDIEDSVKKAIVSAQKSTQYLKFIKYIDIYQRYRKYDIYVRFGSIKIESNLKLVDNFDSADLPKNNVLVISENYLNFYITNEEIINIFKNNDKDDKPLPVPRAKSKIEYSDNHEINLESEISHKTYDNYIHIRQIFTGVKTENITKFVTVFAIANENIIVLRSENP